MRVALLTTESLASAAAVRRFVAADPGRIALVVLSDPFRREAGGSLGQTGKRLRQSGPRILPYLFVNFSLPRLAGLIRRRPTSVEATPLADLAARLGIPVLTLGDVNAPASRAILATSGADLILTFHYDQILAADTIAAVRLGGINVHPGLLPDHRGPAPTLSALLDEPVRFGVTVHRLIPRIDAGPVLAQIALPDGGESALTAARLLHEAALPLLDRVLADLAAGTAEEREVEQKPYRAFPSGSELRNMARLGRRATDLRNIPAALATPIR